MSRLRRRGHVRAQPSQEHVQRVKGAPEEHVMPPATWLVDGDLSGGNCQSGGVSHQGWTAPPCRACRPDASRACSGCLRVFDVNHDAAFFRSHVHTCMPSHAHTDSLAHTDALVHTLLACTRADAHVIAHRIHYTTLCHARHTQTRTQTGTYAHVHAHTHTRTYIHTHTRTHTHTHTHHTRTHAHTTYA